MDIRKYVNIRETLVTSLRAENFCCGDDRIIIARVIIENLAKGFYAQIDFDSQTLPLVWSPSVIKQLEEIASLPLTSELREKSVNTLITLGTLCSLVILALLGTQLALVVLAVLPVLKLLEKFSTHW